MQPHSLPVSLRKYLLRFSGLLQLVRLSQLFAVPETPRLTQEVLSKVGMKNWLSRNFKNYPSGEGVL